MVQGARRARGAIVYERTRAALAARRFHRFLRFLTARGAEENGPLLDSSNES